MSTKRPIRKSLIYALAFVMAMTVTGVSALAESINAGLPPMTYHDVDVDINVVDEGKAQNSAAANMALLPSYSSLDEGWWPSDLQSKNQGSYGTCWAFATTNAADISYSREKKSAVTKNASDPFKGTTSPGLFSQIFYNRPGDPLGLTNSDYTNYVPTSDWRGKGGNNIFSFQAMANRDGLAAESRFPYGSYSSNYNYNFTDLTRVTEDATYYEKASGESNDTFRNNVKQLIQEYGAIATSIYWDSSYEKSGENGTVSYNYPSTGTNHAITLVGWDDNYSKENFTSSNKPSIDGAWLLLNSWGSNRGKNGIYHVSYEDKSLLSDGLVAYNMKDYDGDEMLYQYDGSAGYVYSSVYGGHTTIGNIYTADKDMFVIDVGFTHWNENGVDYTASIYTGISNNKPDSGTESSSVAIHTDHPGYISEPLKTPVFVKKGEQFGVVVKTGTSSCVYGVDKSYQNGNWITFHNSTAAGQSFYKSGSSWTDANGSSYSFRLKAVAVPAYTVTFDNNGFGTKPADQHVGKNQLVKDPNLTSTEAVLEGWYTDKTFAANKKWDFSTSKVTENVTLYANWVVNKVYLNYKSEDTNKGTVSKATESFDNNSVNPEGSTATAKTYYHFVNWTDGNNKSYTSNPLKPAAPTGGWQNGAYNYTAHFAENQYTVKFDKNGGEGTMNDQTIKCTVATALSANKFTKAGYEFKGWSTSSTATTATYTDGAKVTNLKTNDGDSITLYAVWGEKKVTITYTKGTKSSYGKISTTSQSVSALSGEPSCTATPTSKGYRLESWTKGSSSGTVVGTQSVFKPEKVNGEHVAATYYANFAKENYRIEYETNGGTLSGTYTKDYQFTTTTGSVNLPTSSNITKSGYIFDGWYDNADFNGSEVTTVSTNSVDDKKFYAKWSKDNRVAYKILHYQQNLNDDGYTIKETENKTANPGTDVTASSKSYTGFTYQSAKSTASGKVSADGSTELKLYYDRNTYTVQFNNNNVGTKPANQTIRYQGLVTDPNSSATGYTLNGWYKSTSFTSANKWNFNTSTVTAATTLNASWTEHTAMLTYNANGQGTAPSAVTMKYSTEIKATSMTAPSGWTFNGWNTKNDGSGKGYAVDDVVKAANVDPVATTLYAQWSKDHEHTVVPVPVKPATLTADGQKAYYECSDETCKARFFDAAGTEEINSSNEDQLVIPKVSTAKISATNFYYNGKTQKPSVTVKNRLGEAVTYNLTNAGIKSLGTGSVKIVLTGNYSGTKTFSYKMNPKGASLSKLTKGKKQITVKWKKQSSKMASKRITGYQVQIALNSKFTSGAKAYKVKGYKKTSKTIKKLKAKRKYYVRVRTYYGSYYSKWSKVKYIKTK